jgi:hypothetical protein
MADKKISELQNITGANLADGDELVVVDASESETKAITFGEFKTALDTSTGFVRITGDTMTGNLSFGDNDKAIFGAGNDLQIYHDSASGDSTIAESGSGHLKLLGNDIRINNADSSKAYFKATNGGSAIVYYDNAPKLSTTSTGVDITGTLTSDGLTVDTNTLHVDAANNRVGIGTSSPARTLDVRKNNAASYSASSASSASPITSSDAAISIQNSQTYDGSGAYLNLTATNSWGYGNSFYIASVSKYGSHAGSLAFGSRTGATAYAERMRIDGSSGNLLVGKTSSDEGVAGHELREGSFAAHTVSGNLCLNLRRLSSDGDILRFQKDGSSVGSIGVEDTGNTSALYIGFADTGLSFQGHTNNSITPIRTDTGANYNGVLSLGADGSSFKDLYLSGASKHGTGGRTKVEAAKIYDDATNGNSVGIFFGGGQYIGPATGNTGVATDNAVNIGTSSYRFKDLYLSGGVYLGGTGSANKLDDYEEGTWTPAMSGYSGVTYGTRVGYYTKVGRMVMANFYMSITNIGTYTGNSHIAGLPFAAGISNTAACGVQLTVMTALNATRDEHFGALYNGGSSLFIYDKSGNASTRQNRGRRRLQARSGAYSHGH